MPCTLQELRVSVWLRLGTRSGARRLTCVRNLCARSNHSSQPNRLVSRLARFIERRRAVGGSATSRHKGVLRTALGRQSERPVLCFREGSIVGACSSRSGPQDGTGSFASPLYITDAEGRSWDTVVSGGSIHLRISAGTVTPIMADANTAAVLARNGGSLELCLVDRHNLDRVRKVSASTSSVVVGRYQTSGRVVCDEACTIDGKTTKENGSCTDQEVRVQQLLWRVVEQVIRR